MTVSWFSMKVHSTDRSFNLITVNLTKLELCSLGNSSQFIIGYSIFFCLFVCLKNFTFFVTQGANQSNKEILQIQTKALYKGKQEKWGI